MSAEEIAKAFVQHYYQSFDSNADSLAGLFVSPSNSQKYPRWSFRTFAVTQSTERRLLSSYFCLSHQIPCSFWYCSNLSQWWRLRDNNSQDHRLSLENSNKLDKSTMLWNPWTCSLLPLNLRSLYSWRELSRLEATILFISANFFNWCRLDQALSMCTTVSWGWTMDCNNSIWKDFILAPCLTVRHKYLKLFYNLINYTCLY